MLPVHTASRPAAANTAQSSLVPWIVLAALLVLSAVPVRAQTEVATAADILAVPPPPADFRIAYGDDPLQFGDLRLPAGPGPHPVAIVIHGGCWLSRYDIGHIGPLAAALTRDGIATWSLEYRRVGDPGGGWPATFQDAARGADYLSVLARQYPVDLDRVIAVGHSAGGQLALWLAGRSKLPQNSPLHTSGEPIRLRGILGLAVAADLGMVERSGACDRVIDKLMGGSPSEFPERYRQSSPSEMVPLGIRQILINGAHDSNWGPVGLAYFEEARRAGDPVELIVAPESGHFEVIMPPSSTWPLVSRAARRLLSEE